MSLILRPYQQDIIDRARGLISQGSRQFVIEAPTGSGKTVLTAFMFQGAQERRKRAYFCVHRRELIKQSMKTFDEVGIKYGIISAGFKPTPDARVQICSIPTLCRRLGSVPDPDMMVIDECHHCAARSWMSVVERYRRAIQLGLSATPERLDGKGLASVFPQMINGPSVEDLTSQGYLSPYDIYAPGGGIDMTGVRTQMGDWAKGEMNERVDRPSITGDAVSHYLRLAKGKRALVFACGIRHSQRLVEAAREAGVPADHVDGETPTPQRDAAIRRFQDGETLFLSNVELFGEGVDLPAVEVVLIVRPTKSLTWFLQMCGRGLRPAPGKERCLILDHAGNCLRLGLPCDDRQWNLQGRKAREQAAEASFQVRLCPKCYAALKGGVMRCTLCGHAFLTKPRKVAQKEGKLSKVDKAKLKRQRGYEMSQCRTKAELIAYAQRKGYKNPGYWAMRVMDGRRKHTVSDA